MITSDMHIGLGDLTDIAITTDSSGNIIANPTTTSADFTITTSPYSNPLTNTSVIPISSSSVFSSPLLWISLAIGGLILLKK